MKWTRLLGLTLRIAVLGELLFFALTELYVAETGVRIFRYAGF